ncbi:transglutaminase-like cysteine peptidase [Rhizobium alvei]
MSGRMNKAAAVALIVFAGWMGPANAASRFMQTGAVTSQPIGHYEFCELHRDECSVRSTNTAAPKLTDYGWNVVREVNARINAEIMPVTDMEIYGRDEVWAYPTDAGDCEDFVLLKRKELMERGFSASSLLITVVRKPDGEGHAVLTLRTSEGDFILDNLENEVKLWNETPYRYLKRQAAFNSGRWVTIENADELLVGSVD